MDVRLLSNDYDAVAAKLKTLSQDIQHIQRQSDLVGGIDDTPMFRKQLTGKIQSTSRLVMTIKQSLEKVKESENFDGKWKKLEQGFVANFERLKSNTNTIRNKFHESEPHQSKPSASEKDTLKGRGSGVSNGYGSNLEADDNEPDVIRAQSQEQEYVFKPYDELYELENFEEQLYEILQNLQELFEGHKDLNALIYDQQEGIDVLTDNVVEARDNVEQGVQNVDKAAGHQKAYRGKLCILLAVLLVIAIIVTIVVVLSTRNRKK
eukprot:CAMPEP_0197045534 /NCGR_PEP_ID=MMETSP1384-20130603/21369_1 /TAXON_ID=29189 /ORGANISM="Ammonia sp." /LENGTH=263 /DNA_ID=CAMNT_0042477157 /DNA_START=40 /DNA_END=831 /DNA_ORIENTATION=-